MPASDSEAVSARVGEPKVATTDNARAHRIQRLVLPAVCALGAFAAIYVLRRTGALHGLLAIGYAVVLACAIPWSTVLSRRILISGALFLGWLPFLWWIPVSMPDRTGIALAVTSGGLVGWLLWGGRVRSRARRLLPRLASVDAIPVAAVAITAWATWPLLSAVSGVGVLNLLMKTGWDHVAHFAMVYLIRTKGYVVPLLPAAPDGSAWIGSHYPQQFHGLSASITELISGTRVADSATEFLYYARGLALLQILLATLLVAGVAQIPSIRKRPALAWPIAALVIAGFVMGLGSSTIMLGYPNFLLTCAASGLAAYLALSMHGEWRPLEVFALGGLVVAAVHGWLLLAPLTILAACIAFVPLSRSRWPRSRSASAGLWIALAATAVASAAVLPIVLVNDVGDALTLGGPSDFSLSALLPYAGGAIAVALYAAARQRKRAECLRSLVLGAVPALGFLLLAAIAIYQHARTGQVGYYFGKLGLGVTLVGVAVMAAGLALNVRPGSTQEPVRRSRKRWVLSAAATVIASLAVLQLFGYVGPRPRASGFSPSLALQYRADSGMIYAGANESLRLFDAAALAATQPFASSVYVAAMPGDPSPLLASQWQRALSMTWSMDTEQYAPILVHAGSFRGVRKIATVTRSLLGQSPTRRVIVAPQLADRVRALLPEELRARIITWQ